MSDLTTNSKKRKANSTNIDPLSDIVLTTDKVGLGNKKLKTITTPTNAVKNTKKVEGMDDHTEKILAIRKIVKERDQARDDGEFTKSDNIRDKLTEMGVFVIDQKGGPSGWRFLDGSSKKLPNNVVIPKPESLDGSKPKLTALANNGDQKRKQNQNTNDISSKKSNKGDSAEQSRNKAALNSLMSKSADSVVVQGVTIKDIKIGTGDTAQIGHKVKVNYVGKLKSNDKVFDSSKKPFAFRLGRGEVIKGWDIGVAGMKIGGKRTLTIPPEKGYGKSGSPPVIPGNAILVFDVTLLGLS
eukprot:gene3928-7841_t